MAKKVTVTLVDDFDGEGAADETVEFGLDGVTYEIDLSAKNATKLRNDLKQWVEAGRRVGGRRRGRASAGRGNAGAAGSAGRSGFRWWRTDRVSKRETIRSFPALHCCNRVVAGDLRVGGVGVEGRKVGSPAGGPLQWTSGTRCRPLCRE